MSDKIKPQHVARKAMLYVRQSSAYQVLSQSRKPAVAVCDAGPVAPLGLARDRGRG